jgi:hypothetical protein
MKPNQMGHESDQVAVTQGDIRAIRRDVELVSEKVNDVHQALIGSELAKDGGMVKRLMDCENEVDKLREKLSDIEASNEKSVFYLKIIWALGGAILTGAVGFILTHLLK